jgi:hypothetical protein
MSLQKLHPDHVDETRRQAYSVFAPVLINSLTHRLARCQGTKELGDLEKSLVRLIESAQVDEPQAEAMREFAIELVVSTISDARNHPDAKGDVEAVGERRAEGRSENPDTLEEQLQSGLEDSFPASDPPAVVSTAISGASKDLVGTDEVLRRKKEAAQRKQEKADASS